METLKTEIGGLLELNAFEFVSVQDIPENRNIICGRIIKSTKNPLTEDERYKARLLVQWQKDKDK